MPMIETRDRSRLYVKSWGEGPAVVLIHGWPLNADSWDSQMLGLAEAGFRAIAYDRRGFGRSDQPWHGYDYDTFADDLADVMQATGATDGVTLAGFSMGGGEVARYMARHGKGVVKAALISAAVPFLAETPDNPDGLPQEEGERMMAAVRADRAAFFTGFFLKFYGAGSDGIAPGVSEEALTQAHRWAMMAGLWPTLAAMQAFSTTDFRPDLDAFDVETLVIHGTSDAIVPIALTGHVSAARITGARLIEYDGAPHGVGLTHAVELTRDLVGLASS